MRPSIVALIPARGGSRGILRKNIVSVGGKPLIAYTIEAARASRYVTHTIVSTDNPEIAEVSRQWGAEVPFLRPAELAQDATPALPVILHAIETLAASGEMPEVIVYLQPTSPLRTAVHIDEAVGLLRSSGADTVVSTVEVPHQFHPTSVMRMVSDGRLTTFDGKPVVPQSRHEKVPVYARNGPAVLAMRCASVLAKREIYGDDMRGFVMRAEDSIDIDTPDDLREFEHILASRERVRA
jgi:CMP-N-acetylneuraminic acid synthetase